ncbi:hypothetical protein BDW66DRAFT_127963, partial [Aspergillus desertorum]
MTDVCISGWSDGRNRRQRHRTQSLDSAFWLAVPVPLTLAFFGWELSPREELI